MDLLKDLNEEQRSVVTAGDGPILVIAGAGSGKTRTLTYRVAHLVSRGVPVERILLCTFTNKAAKEMVDRVGALIGHSIDNLWAGTFHHIANRFLRRHAERLGFGTNYTILDRDDSSQLIDSIIVEGEYKKKVSKRFPTGRVLGGIFGYANSTGYSVEEVVYDLYDEKFGFIAEEIGDVARAYDIKKHEFNAMDFDDLLLNWFKLLNDFPDIKRHYGELFEHILVDEYQDTNPLQANIVDDLAHFHKNITVVGDDAQSIYGFRGADCQHILNFPHRYKDCQTHYLQTNYRSTPPILDAANRVIKYNPNQFPKSLEAMREEGPQPSLVMAETSEGEAHWIAKEIKKLRSRGISLDDIAILYRIHSHSLELQIALQKEGIPFVLRSGMRFFEQAHIKDMLAWLRIVYNVQDLIAWQRVLALLEGVGAQTIKKILRKLEECEFEWQALRKKEWQKKLSAKARKSLSWLLQHLEEALMPDNKDNPSFLMQSFYDQEYEDYLVHTHEDASSRIDDITEFIGFALRYDTLSHFLSEMILQTELEEIPPEEEPEQDPEEIILSTVHQAKGLEWKYVFCLNLVDGSFPFFLALDEDGGLEEERRLFYVATTRAKDRLYLCSRQTFMTKTGYPRSTTPSRFLWELLEDPVTEYSGEISGGPLGKFLLEIEELSIFDVIYV